MNTRRSWLTLGLLPVLLVGAIVLPFLLYWGQLPNPMATHWGFKGAPDSSMPPIVILGLFGGIYGAFAVAATRASKKLPGEAPSFLAFLYGVGGLLATASWLMVLANRDVADWTQAGSFGVLQLALVMLVGIGVGAIGWFLGGGSGAVKASAPAPALGGIEPQNTVWSGRGSGWVLTGIGIGMIIIGLAIWSLVTLMLVFIGVFMLMFAEVRTTVSSGGVVVSLGWLGIPSWTVPISDISEARVEEVRPMAYGGWGYRVKPGVRAILTRGGEGLYLVRPDKADLVLTVDDALTGAGLVNSMLGVGQRQA